MKSTCSLCYILYVICLPPSIFGPFHFNRFVFVSQIIVHHSTIRFCNLFCMDILSQSRTLSKALFLVYLPSLCVAWYCAKFFRLSMMYPCLIHNSKHFRNRRKQCGAEVIHLIDWIQTLKETCLVGSSVFSTVAHNHDDGCTNFELPPPPSLPDMHHSWK